MKSASLSNHKPTPKEKRQIYARLNRTYKNKCIDSKTVQDKTEKNMKDPQKKYCLGRVSKIVSWMAY